MPTTYQDAYESSTASTAEIPPDEVASSPAPNPELVVLGVIETLEEIPETSKEVEAFEEILPHKGWNPIKYRWELEDRVWIVNLPF